MMTKRAKEPESIDEKMCERASISSVQKNYVYTFFSCYFNSWRSKYTYL